MKRNRIIAVVVAAFYLWAFPACDTTKYLWGGLTKAGQIATKVTDADTADQVIFRAEQVAELGFTTFHFFVTFEKEHKAMLFKLNPKIHEYSNVIRREGLQWVEELRAATKAFKDSRTEDNRATIAGYIKLIQTGISTVNKHMAEATVVTSP